MRLAQQIDDDNMVLESSSMTGGDKTEIDRDDWLPSDVNIFVRSPQRGVCAKLTSIHWSQQCYLSENPVPGSKPGRKHDWRGNQAF